MSCRVLTTSRLRTAEENTPGEAFPDSAGSAAPTRILDAGADAIRELAGATRGDTDAEFLRAAYLTIRDRVRPVYSLDEMQAASRTLAKGRGSCSQRLAVLEAAARARGIATRVRCLIVDGAFWYPRFPALTRFVPEVILLAWPQFLADGEWLDAADLFPAAPYAAPFVNAGAETLFDAIGRGAAHWQPTPRCDCGDALLAGSMRADLGWASSRDEVFARYGQNLPCPVRVAVEPVFGRWAAGARAA